MKTIVIIAALALTGCAHVAGILPSLQHCSDVKYERHANQIDLTAKCTAPIGASL